MVDLPWSCHVLTPLKFEPWFSLQLCSSSVGWVKSTQMVMLWSGSFCKPLVFINRLNCHVEQFCSQLKLGNLNCKRRSNFIFKEISWISFKGTKHRYTVKKNSCNKHVYFQTNSPFLLLFHPTSWNNFVIDLRDSVNALDHASATSLFGSPLRALLSWTAGCSSSSLLLVFSAQFENDVLN